MIIVSVKLKKKVFFSLSFNQNGDKPGLSGGEVLTSQNWKKLKLKKNYSPLKVNRRDNVGGSSEESRLIDIHRVLK